AAWPRPLPRLIYRRYHTTAGAGAKEPGKFWESPPRSGELLFSHDRRKARVCPLPKLSHADRKGAEWRDDDGQHGAARRPDTNGRHASLAGSLDDVGQRIWAHARDDARGTFAEQRGQRVDRRAFCRQIDPRPDDPAFERARLRERDRQTSVAYVVSAGEPLGASELEDELLEPSLRIEIDRRRFSRELSELAHQPLARAEGARAGGDRGAEEQDRVARVLERHGHHVVRRSQEPDPGDRGSRQDGNGRDHAAALHGRLVVEAHVPAHDRDVERLASRRDSVDGEREGRHDLGSLGVSEIEAVGDADRLGARRRQVAAALGDGARGPDEGVELTGPAVAVDSEGEELVARVAAGDPDDGP